MMPKTEWVLKVLGAVGMIFGLISTILELWAWAVIGFGKQVGAAWGVTNGITFVTGMILMLIAVV